MKKVLFVITLFLLGCHDTTNEDISRAYAYCATNCSPYEGSIYHFNHRTKETICRCDTTVIIRE